MEVKNQVQDELENYRTKYTELESIHSSCLEKEKSVQEEIDQHNLQLRFEAEFAIQKKRENDLRKNYDNLHDELERVTNKLIDTENKFKLYTQNSIAEKEKLEEEINKYYKSANENETNNSEIEKLTNELTNLRDFITNSNAEKTQMKNELIELKKNYSELEQLYKTSLTKEKLLQQELNDIKAIHEVEITKIKTSEENFKVKYDNLLKENEGSKNSSLNPFNPSLGSEENKLKTNCEELTDCDLQDPGFHSGTVDGYTILKNLFECYNKSIVDLNDLLDSLNSQSKNDKLQDLSNFFKTTQVQIKCLSEQNDHVKNQYFNTDVFKNHVDNVIFASLKDFNETLQKQLYSKTQENLMKNKDYISKIREAFAGVKHSVSSSVKLDFCNNNNNEEINELTGILQEMLSYMFELKSKVIVLSDSNINIISEKNQEIERLNESSDQLTQELFEKSQTIKEYENEIAELSKNNDLLIADLEAFKNNHLETISEIDEDKTILLEEQLEQANAKIEELKFQLENSSEKQEETTKTKIEEEEDDNSYLELLNKHDALQIEYDTLKRDYSDIETELQTVMEENAALNSAADSMKANNENLLYIQDEMKTLNESLHAEIGMYQEKLNSLIDVDAKLKAANDENDELKKEIFAVEEKLNKEEHNKNLLKAEVESNEIKFQTLNKEYLDAMETLRKLEKNLEELEPYRKECEVLKNRIEDLILDNKEEIKTNEIPETEVAEGNINDLQQENMELKKQMETLTNSHTELIQLVTTKHQENVSYHTEIQRLNHLLTNESQKCVNFETQINNLSQIISNEKRQTEKLSEENSNLREQCNLLSQSLLEEQSKMNKLLEEKSQPSEAEILMKKKLERLQAHLVELEEHYTSELYEAEQKNQALQLKVNEIEEREKSSSNMYTSVSIRANQQVESLQKQLSTVTNERDSLRKQISDMEDNINKQSAALTNLQLVLEQFRKDKEKEVHRDTERLRRQINNEKKIQEELKNEISSLKSQLEESKQGLLAASRLSDQLEISRNTITALKEEVHQLQNSVASKQEELKAALSQTDGKVDKSLLKNLIIGFVTSNNNLNKDQTQILKIIGTVLDFDQVDHDKLNLNKSLQGSWLTAFSSPQSNLQKNSQESLSRAFIQFLEQESKPRVVPSLLNNTNGEVDKHDSRRSSTSRQTPGNLTEIVLPTFADFAQNRNSSSILKDVLKDHN